MSPKGSETFKSCSIKIEQHNCDEEGHAFTQVQRVVRIPNVVIKLAFKEKSFYLEGIN